MNIDGFISMPSFRPDGRLERLNFGGGSDREKQQRMVDVFTGIIAQKNAQKAKASKGGQAHPQQQQQQSQSQARQPEQASGGNRPAATYGQGGQVSPPQALSTTAAPKKRRTLLSGTGRSFTQPYGNDTILGA
jgi:hypothetical protein